KLAHFERARTGVEKKKDELKEKEEVLNEELRSIRAEKLVVDTELKRLQDEEKAREVNRIEIRSREFVLGRVQNRQRRSRRWLVAAVAALSVVFLVLVGYHSWSIANVYAAFPDGMFTALLW